jgi:uncharacterized protein YjbJ (UPF0337 family)
MGEFVDKGKGRIKQAIGDLTGNKKLRNEGKRDEIKGKVEGAVDEAKSAVKHAVRNAKKSIKNAEK